MLLRRARSTSGEEPLDVKMRHQNLGSPVASLCFLHLQLESNPFCEVVFERKGSQVPTISGSAPGDFQYQAER